MGAIYLQSLVVDSVLALDPTGKFQRVFIDPASTISMAPAPPPAPLGDAQSSAAAFTGTLTPISTKTAAITGFDLTVAAVLALTGAAVTVTGLAVFPAGTISFALSLLTNGTSFIWRPPVPLPASAINTPIVVHIPATGVTTDLVVYGQQS